MPAASGVVEISVLTPAVEGQFHVASGFDPASLLPPFQHWSNHIDVARTRALRELVTREGYDPGSVIAARLVKALNDASLPALPEPIARRPAGRLQSLSWGDLPESPKGKAMLDVTIRWIGMTSDVAYSKLWPSIAISWRLLGPRQEILEPSRELVYHHRPPSPVKPRRPPPAGKRSSTAARTPPPPAYPAVTVTASCGIDSLRDAESDPRAFWACFDETISAVIDRLVIDLKRERGLITASADTPS
ncbi:MAG: hypothetical protein ACREVI_02865 [Steroidobacteraceae bacterium]